VGREAAEAGGDAYGVGMGGAGEAGSGLYAGMARRRSRSGYRIDHGLCKIIDAALEFAQQYATDSAKKWLINQALNYVRNALAGGSAVPGSVSLEGMDGDLSWLYNDMKGIAPKSSQFSFSAGTAWIMFPAITSGSTPTKARPC